MRGQLGRLAAIHDRLEDIGREKGERQDTADVTIADAFLCREFVKRSHPPRHEAIDTARRSAKFVDQDRIGCGGSRGVLYDEPHLDAAPLNAKRNVPDEPDSIEPRGGALGEQQAQMQPIGSKLDAIDQGGECRSCPLLRG